MHQLAPNAILHFYVPPHFICLLLLFFLLFFMYQLTQIPFQNFFSILCTNRSPSPFDFHSSETSADPHHVAPTPHQATLAPPHTRRYVFTFPRPPPPCRTPNRTTASYFQPYNYTTVPLHRTTAPHHCTAPPHRTQASQSYHRTTVPPHLSPALQTYHRKYNIPHSQAHDLLTTQIYDPDTRRPDRRNIDATPTPPPP